MQTKNRISAMRSEKEQMKLSRIERMQQLEEEKQRRIMKDREDAREREDMLRFVCFLLSCCAVLPK